MEKLVDILNMMVIFYLYMIFAMKYKANQDTLVIAGKDYGMGSSRDWAAKGANLLGVKVVLAESFERIHRSNLVMMGIFYQSIYGRRKC